MLSGGQRTGNKARHRGTWTARQSVSVLKNIKLLPIRYYKNRDFVMVVHCIVLLYEYGEQLYLFVEALFIFGGRGKDHRQEENMNLQIKAAGRETRQIKLKL